MLGGKVMKKWKCTVCGYIHIGENPPRKCPQCGAPRKKFVLWTGEETSGMGEAGLPPMPVDVEADVLIVGTGAAAFSAAVTARANGADVIMLEKGTSIGGTTIRSGGGFWIPNNRFQRELGIEDRKEDALRYMARYSFPHLYVPDDPTLGLSQHDYSLLEAFYDKASEMVDFLEQTGALRVIQEINWTGRPQVDYQDHLPENKGIRGRTLYPRDSEGKMGYGYEMIRQFEEWARDHGIQILPDHRATRILLNSQGEVCGLEVSAGTEVRIFKARKAVIFGSGGYSHNKELMLNFQRGPHFGGCAAPTNTGDFIILATENGAKLGNMAGAFRAQSIFESVLADPGGSNNVFYIPGDSVILVNKYGNRFVNEKRNYTDRTMTHFVWDPQQAEWTQMLTFLIFDSRTATLWQGFPPYPVQGAEPSYIIKADTLEELAEAIETRLDSLKGHTGGFSLAPDFKDNLKKTVARFNQFALNGKDEDFQRGDFAYDREWTTFPPTIPGQEWPSPDSKNYTMHPFSDGGPYYAIILSAGTLDTNGGPVINEKAQVMHIRGNPIPGLYGAGNCIASPTANAYWGGGSTIGPAMTFGYIAGLNAVQEPEKVFDLKTTTRYVWVASTDEVEPGTMKKVMLENVPVLLANIDGTYYAVDNTCTHKGGSLSRGTLQGNNVVCPRHGATFDVTTGKAIPTGKKLQVHDLKSYPVIVQGSEILLGIE